MTNGLLWVGRYGTEANFIITNGADALATDYSDKLLKIGKRVALLKNIKKMQTLTFKDQSFDYVLIKLFITSPDPG